MFNIIFNILLFTRHLSNISRKCENSACAHVSLPIRRNAYANNWQCVWYT